MFADLQNQQLFCFTNTVSSHQRIFEKGSLSNDVGDGNENGKKAIGLDWQNNLPTDSGILEIFLRGIRNLGNFSSWNPESWALESEKQL